MHAQGRRQQGVGKGGVLSRSGYSDGIDTWDLIRWRGAVASAIRGKRGQAFFREMKEALEALPEKRLIAGDLVSNGECCAMGAVALNRGMDVTNVDPEDRDDVAATFGIAPALAAEISFENDECYVNTPEQRYEKMYKWVLRRLSDGPDVPEAYEPRR